MPSNLDLHVKAAYASRPYSTFDIPMTLSSFLEASILAFPHLAPLSRLLFGPPSKPCHVDDTTPLAHLMNTMDLGPRT